MQNTIVRRAVLGWALCLLSGAMMTGRAETNPGFGGDSLLPRPREVLPGTGFAAADAAISCVTGAVPEAAGALAANESYRIDITPSGVRLTAPTEKGFRYAKTTLAQLRKLSGGRLPCGTIVDWPAFRYRGFMLDVGRNWQPLENIREILDFMAAYKLNLFHWHLTDYWGWRLESKAVPELNTDAATIRNVGKRYTQEEFLSVVDYAAVRGITVLPEFDVPGHTEAFRRALGIATMRDPEADRALKAFFDEFVALVPPERMPYIHLGTDEVRNEPEKVDPSVVRTWAKHAAAKGHTIIGWAPGIDLAQDGIRSAKMQWGSKDESAGLPFLDMTSRYIDVIDPLQILGMAAYAKPCPWHVPDEQALGALIGCWHDDLLTDPDQLFTNNAVFPAIVANADAFWCGRPKHRVASAVRLPQPDDPDLALAVDLERRVIAQRDCVLGSGFRRPFAFVAQTPMRWSLRYADGTLIAKDVPQATIILHQKGVAENLCPKTNATVVAETWIRSEKDRTVGAWIGFTGLSRSSGRSIDSPLPDRGQWNRHGATVELNGERIAPPDWVNAGLRTTAEEMKMPHFWSFSALSNKIPWTNEEYYMRPPTPIRLKKGWNHVKLTMPSPDPEPYACRHAWCMTFVPVLGTSAHPREVPGLEYRSEP